MMKKLLYIAALFILMFTYHLYHTHFTAKMLVGTYQRVQDMEPLPEIPHRISDTVTLKSDGTFESTYWGKGTYTINTSWEATHVELSYDYSFGKAGFSTTIERSFFSKPRIVLFSDLNHYMQKID